MKLKVEYVSPEALDPYPGNAKLHPADQVEQIKESIQEFGFNDPIAVWKNNEIIEGHGRVIAALELGLKEVPIIRLDELTDDERRAYTLVHNQLTLNSGLDYDLLELEVENLESIDMEKYGFELKPWDPPADEHDDDIGWYGDERERTFEKVNLFDYDESRTAGFYNMPVIEKVNHEPSALMTFNYALNTDDFSKGICFYIDDYQFERLWNEPHKYMERLSQFDCCLTPDFSLYTDMPIAMQVWNVYRSRLIGQIMQDYGMRVIPTLSWSTPDSYNFCFDGLEKGGTVSVSTVGVMNSEDSQKIWRDGMDEAIKRLEPTLIVAYGSKIDYDFNGIKVKYFEARKGWQDDKA